MVYETSLTMNPLRLTWDLPGGLNPVRTLLGLAWYPGKTRPRPDRDIFRNLVFNMILRTHQIPENVFLLKMFFDDWDLLDFPYMPNTKKSFLSKIFSNESQTSPGQVQIGSWVGQVRPQSSPVWVPEKSQVGLGKVRASPGGVPVKSG